MYKDFDHGYAATVHKTQGSTLDHTFVLGSRHFDKHTAYVAMSRHREECRPCTTPRMSSRTFEDLKEVMGREQPKSLIVDYGLPRGIEVDNRLIQAERVMSSRGKIYSSQEWQQQRDEEQYVKQMKGRGVQVEFPKDKLVAGYYTRVEEVGGKNYAVIETHADPTKGVRYLVPYDKQYDQMQTQRYVAYNGQKMEYSEQSKTPEKGIQHRLSPENQGEKSLSQYDLHLTPVEWNYCQRMEAQGIKIDFPRERAMEGYYTRVEEVGGNKYAVIESQGIRHMVPYDKQYDQMQTQRYVAYDGQKMSSAKAPSADIGIDKNKGPGLGK